MMWPRIMTALLLLSWGVFAWVSCQKGEMGTLSSRVVDLKGDAVPDAVISIEGLRARVHSQGDGSFELAFPPGSFEMNIDAEGYLPLKRPWNVTQSLDLEAAPITIIRRPGEIGLFRLGEGGYREISPGALVVDSPEEGRFLSATRHHVAFEGKQALSCFRAPLIWSSGGGSQLSARAFQIQAGDHLWPLEEGPSSGQAVSLESQDVGEGHLLIRVKGEGDIALLLERSGVEPKVYGLRLDTGCASIEGGQGGQP